MNDGFVSRFLKGVLSTGIGTMASVLLGFLNVVIAVRIVPKDEFGAYVLLLVMVSFFTMAADMGLSVSTTRFIAGGGPASREDTAGTMLSFKVAATLIVSLAVALSTGVAGRIFGSDLLPDLLVYIPLLFLLESLNSFLTSVMQGLHYYKKLAVAQICLGIMNFGCIVLFVAGLGMGVRGLIYARAAAVALAAVYQIRALPFAVRLRWDGRLFREIFGFGFPLGLNGALTFVFTKVDTLIIGALVSPVGVAYYGAASKIPDSSRQLFNSFKSVYFPNMSELYNKDQPREAEKVLNNSLRAVAFASTLATLVVFLFQDSIVKLLFSDKYIDSAPVLSILMFALCVALVGNVLGTTLVSAGHSRLPVVINIVDTVVNVAANLLLVPVFGIIGAASAALISRTATNPVNVIFLKRSGIGVDVMQYVKPMAALAACAGMCHFSGMDSVPARLVVLAVFCGLCNVMSVITVDDFSGLVRGLRYRAGQSVATDAEPRRAG
ncbi:MAG TPA: flippase [Nitrospirota bacterium]